jgi:hypothetical protein
MRIVVPHHSTQKKTIAKVDESWAQLFDFGSTSVILADQKKSWTGPRMEFSLTAKMGFIAVPLSGSVLVDDVNITIDCELPALVRNFIGEDKISGSVEQRLTRLLSA